MGIVGTLGFLNFLDSKIQKAIDVAVADGTIPKNKIEDLSRSMVAKLNDKPGKICIIARTGIWHNVTFVPDHWTISMCSELKNTFAGDAYYMGCSFPDRVIYSERNEPVTPTPNCGW